MLKNVLFAVAIVVTSSPAFVSAKDLFLSFDQNARVNNQVLVPGTISGKVYIFADENLDFNQLDLDFTVSGAAAFTGGVVFNPGSPDSGMSSSADGGVFTQVLLSDPDPDNIPFPQPITATDGRLTAVSFLTPGQLPGSEASNFRPGANGFVLAGIDFDFVGFGTANFDLVLGELGIVNDGSGQIPVTFGPSASVTLSPPLTVPEPSSAALLILGAAGMVARRRRS